MALDQTQAVERLGASTQFTCTATAPSTLSALLTFEWERDGDRITSGQIEIFHLLEVLVIEWEYSKETFSDILCHLIDEK